MSRPVVHLVGRRHLRRWRHPTITELSKAVLLMMLSRRRTSSSIICRRRSAVWMTLRARRSGSGGIVDVVGVVDVRIIGADTCSGNRWRPLIEPLVLVACILLPLLALCLLLAQFLLLLRFAFSQLLHSLSDCNQPTTPELMCTITAECRMLSHRSRTN